MDTRLHDRRVIAWLIQECALITPDDAPPDWELIHLRGGCYDGLQFYFPPLAGRDGHELYLPTTAIDRPGGPCHAVYRIDGANHAGTYAGIRCDPCGDAVFVNSPD
jgi:hypothetical protein